MYRFNSLTFDIDIYTTIYGIKYISKYVLLYLQSYDYLYNIIM